MTAYYNEIEPGAAAWLRELIKHNLIAPGDVDERSIEDVTANDLLGYTQCHFFAGIGVWSYALRLAGIPDDYPVWTGSCPCQPFSAAGKGKGFADERHLWPAFGWLIQQCRPERVFGEQVAGKDGLAWLDLVSADVEALGYTLGAVPFAAAGIGAPHIRERLYWVADANDQGLEGRRQPGRECAAEWAVGACGMAGGVEVSDRQRRQGFDALLRQDEGWGAGDIPQASGRSEACRLADRESGGWGEERPDGRGRIVGDSPEGIAAGSGASGRNSWPGAVDSFWSDADWLGCRDGKWRPVEPGTFPLAHGAAARVGRLRGYGNGLVAQQAAAFIESYFEVRAAA